MGAAASHERIQAEKRIKRNRAAWKAKNISIIESPHVFAETHGADDGNDLLELAVRDELRLHQAYDWHLPTVAMKYGIELDAGDHPSTLHQVFIENLGQLAADTLVAALHRAIRAEDDGFYAASRTLFEEVLATYLDGSLSYPVTKGQMAMIKMQYAAVVYHQGELQMALDLFGQVVADQIYDLGNEHEFTLAAKYNYGVVLQELAELEDAQKVYTELLEEQGKELGPTHPAKLRSQLQIASAILSQGGIEQAEGMLTEVIAGLQENCTSKDPSVFYRKDITCGELRLARFNLGVLREKQDKLPEALELIESALVPELKFRADGPSIGNGGKDQLPALRRGLAVVQAQVEYIESMKDADLGGTGQPTGPVRDICPLDYEYSAARPTPEGVNTEGGRAARAARRSESGGELGTLLALDDEILEKLEALSALGELDV